MNMMIFMQFIAFPERSDALLRRSASAGEVVAASSGSMGLFRDGKCRATHPNATLGASEKADWCSSVAWGEGGDSGRAWVQYSVRDRAMKLTGFSLRSGCCLYDCCCVDDSTVYDYYCCCRMYSFSLVGSNDNKTWKTIHKVEKDSKFHFCEAKTYEFAETQSFRFVRLVQDGEYPGCLACMQINQVELYGKAVAAEGFVEGDDGEGDESVSIIGKVTRQSID